MSRNFKDLTGQKFGRLTVIKRDSNDKYGFSKWLCECECGNTVSVMGVNLTKGSTKSCGCLRKEHSGIRKHGDYKARLYGVYKGIKSRCANANNKAYPRYGAKGITICKEWETDYVAFRDWALANGYKEGLSIDRIDNSKGYSPDNCRWADIYTQANNKSCNINYTYKNETHTIGEWARLYNITYNALYFRLKRNIPIEKALTMKGRY